MGINKINNSKDTIREKKALDIKRKHKKFVIADYRTHHKTTEKETEETTREPV